MKAISLALLVALFSTGCEPSAQTSDAAVYSPPRHGEPASDAENCQCTIYWLVRHDAVEGRDYEVDALTWLWDLTTRADKTIIGNNWKGIQSRYYESGPFATMENMEARYIDWLLQELAD